MKRHPALQAFSREHHHALSLSNRIRNHPEQDHQADIQALRDELLQHFIEEENMLSQYWSLLAKPTLKQRFEEDHAQLRQLLQPPYRAFELAEVLMAHVRFEERELFTALQTLEPLQK